MDSTLSYVYYNLGKLYGLKDQSKDSSMYFYGRAVTLDPDRFHDICHTIADFYYDKKDLASARQYYEFALGTPSFTRDQDLERLIGILVAQKNPAAASDALKKYLNPRYDNDLLARLTSLINQATDNK
ncbi:MAG TPA: hypothetical protein VKR32_03420, partial [Puia sp.]|nr:hypothetical protein [Puia sp.]